MALEPPKRPGTGAGSTVLEVSLRDRAVTRRAYGTTLPELPIDVPTSAPSNRLRA